MVQQQSNSSSHTLALCAGAGACFLAGWTAHAAFRSGWRPTAHHDASSRRQPAHLMPTHLSGGDTPSQSPSAASTPRGGYPASLTEQNGHKMALLVRTDITLGKGRTAVLCAHGALQQYKKVYRRGDPARMEWEETGSKKLCLAVHNSQQLTDIRHAAKSQGVPTYIINDERATGSPESIVLVIGPAAGGTIDNIAGDLKILD